MFAQSRLSSYVRLKMAKNEIPIIEFQTWLEPTMLAIAVLLIFITGISAIFHAKLSSNRYKYTMAALGFSLVVCMIFYWIHRDMTIADIEWYRATTNTTDTSLEGQTKAIGFLNRMNFLYCAGVGLILGIVSLLLRKESEQAESGRRRVRTSAPHTTGRTDP